MYRNIVSYVKNNKQMVWLSTWDKDGNRIVIEEECKPHLYMEVPLYDKPDGKSMFGCPVKRFEFNTNKERSTWMEANRNTRLFECLPVPKQYLLDKFWGQEQSHDFQKYPLRTFFFDIEVEIEDEFPEPEYALYPINVISVYDTMTGKISAWTYRKDIFDVFSEEDIARISKEVPDEFEEGLKIEVFRFNSERELLKSFIKYWRDNFPDILSGWNIVGFDVPYLVNRIKKVLGDGKERELSPIDWYRNCVSPRKDSESYEIMGISVCDYLPLYKKFIPKSQQSWKLDYMAKKDVGKGKLDYYDLGYDSLRDFMRKDFATFVKYNLIDSTLVKQIDDQRHFIGLMRKICNIRSLRV